MCHSLTQQVCCIILLAFFSQAVALGGTTRPAKEYKVGWLWTDVQATAIDCATSVYEPYNVRLETTPRGGLTLSIVREGTTLYSWRGHPYSVFAIRNGRLYYTIFSPLGTGGSVVAVDLTTGKQLWETPLKALGIISHAPSVIRMNLSVIDEVVIVYGCEGPGRYIEIKLLTTGETVGHRVVGEEE
jgi:hypothetical protein